MTDKHGPADLENITNSSTVSNAQNLTESHKANIYTILKTAAVVSPILIGGYVAYILRNNGVHIPTFDDDSSSGLGSKLIEIKDGVLLGGFSVVIVAGITEIYRKLQNK